MLKRLIFLLVLAGAGGAAYYFANREPSELVLTGIVTTNDVIVSPQIGGRLEKVLVTEGDEVHRDQLLAVLAPAELQAESSYAIHNAEGVTSQVVEAQAALRFEERQAVEQIRQAESNLASVEAQQPAAAVDVESTRLTYERMQRLARDGVAAASQLDDARTAYQGAQARADALKKQADASR